MHHVIYREFERVCRRRNAGGAVLEVGAVPSRASLLLMPLLAGCERVGLDLDGPHECDGFRIERGDANAMPFPDARFDTILCNSMLEHDRYFWKTLAEIRRVARPGALIVIGVPGYARRPPPRPVRMLRRFARLPWVGPRIDEALASTPTLLVHDYPGDYYRFSEQAALEVLFEGLHAVELKTLMTPPRIVGSGLAPTSGR